MPVPNVDLLFQTLINYIEIEQIDFFQKFYITFTGDYLI